MIYLFENATITDKNLREAIEALLRDNDFLKPVFTDEFINTYKDYKFEREIWPDEGRPTAYEFATTYQC